MYLENKIIRNMKPVCFVIWVTFPLLILVHPVPRMVLYVQKAPMMEG